MTTIQPAEESPPGQIAGWRSILDTLQAHYGDLCRRITATGSA
jgi:hypothetical protein